MNPAVCCVCSAITQCVSVSIQIIYGESWRTDVAHTWEDTWEDTILWCSGREWECYMTIPICVMARVVSLFHCWFHSWLMCSTFLRSVTIRREMFTNLRSKYTHAPDCARDVQISPDHALMRTLARWGRESGACECNSLRTLVVTIWQCQVSSVSEVWWPQDFSHTYVVSWHLETDQIWCGRGHAWQSHVCTHTLAAALTFARWAWSTRGERLRCCSEEFRLSRAIEPKLEVHWFFVTVCSAPATKVHTQISPEPRSCMHTFIWISCQSQVQSASASCDVHVIWKDSSQHLAITWSCMVRSVSWLLSLTVSADRTISFSLQAAAAQLHCMQCSSTYSRPEDKR